MESRESLINQIALLHEEKEHQKIIALIEGQPPAAMDYELTSLLARAYINYAQPYMDSFQEHIKHAVELLRRPAVVLPHRHRPVLAGRGRKRHDVLGAVPRDGPHPRGRSADHRGVQARP